MPEEEAEGRRGVGPGERTGRARKKSPREGPDLEDLEREIMAHITTIHRRPEFVTCPGCGYRQVPRSTLVCPACGRDLGEDVARVAEILYEWDRFEPKGVEP